jgi:hypothetical protein
MMNPESATPKVSAWSRFRGLIRLLIIVVVLAAIVLFLFPLIFKPRIDLPASLQYGSPSSLEFRISNQNLTPLTDIAYTCEVSKLTLANGSEDTKAKAIIHGSVRKIQGRHAVIGRCETGDIVTAAIKAAEYRVTMTYKTYPWPQQRTGVYGIGAQVNANGEVTGWKLK